jgi:formamidopyrimidine-DNA glycosylase
MHRHADPLERHTHVRIGVGDRELRFVDPRTFGELFVAEGRDGTDRPVELAALGPDALAPGVEATELRAILQRRSIAIKALLLDQRAIAGIGNIYADEICFDAGVRPSRPASSISPARVARIASSITSILSAAVDAGGSTLRDARYRGVRGEAGGFQDHHAVYAREGAPCLGCGTTIRRVRIAGRSAHFCPKCQR